MAGIMIDGIDVSRCGSELRGSDVRALTNLGTPAWASRELSAREARAQFTALIDRLLPPRSSEPLELSRPFVIEP